MEPEANQISNKRSGSLIQDARESKKLHLEEPEVRVNRLIQILNYDGQSINWNRADTLGHFLVDSMRTYPEEQTIWLEVFKKLNSPHLSLPLGTIQFGPNHSCALPECVWAIHSQILSDMVKGGCKEGEALEKDIPPENIHAFIQCLYMKWPHCVMTLENFADVDYLASKYGVVWLRYRTMEFMLNTVRYSNNINAICKWMVSVAKWQIDENNPSLGEFLFDFNSDWEVDPAIRKKANESALPELAKIFKTEELIDTIHFPHGLTCTLPRVLWQFHSAYFETYFMLKEDKPLQDNINISKESVEAFIQCLEQCSINPLNLENYFDIYELAEKFQFSWLVKWCTDSYDECGIAAIWQKDDERGDRKSSL